MAVVRMIPKVDPFQQSGKISFFLLSMKCPGWKFALEQNKIIRNFAQIKLKNWNATN